MIKPTVGRVVWFYKFDGKKHTGPLAAHVCQVKKKGYSETSVDFGSPGH
jgi:hypothetical protein